MCNEFKVRANVSEAIQAHLSSNKSVAEEGGKKKKTSASDVLRPRIEHINSDIILFENEARGMVRPIIMKGTRKTP